VTDTDWGIIGHDWAVRLLRRALAQGELSHAYLFTGPSGVGKETLALALARAALCQSAEKRPCGLCHDCRLVTSGNHPDLHRVSPETASGRSGVQQVRELERLLSLTPTMGRYRVAILSNFDQATPAAANALLKTLEEPPAYVLLLLLAPDSDTLLPTIVSRCQMVPLRPLPARQVEQALIERWEVEPQRARLLAHLCGGRLGWAVRAARDPALLQRRTERLEELTRLLGANRVERFRYAAELASNLDAAQETLEWWGGWWRDVMILAAGGAGSLTNVDLEERARQQAQALGVARAAALVQATRRAADLLRRNANPQLTLEVLIGFDLPLMRQTRPASPTAAS